MSYEMIEFTRDSGVAKIRLNRPAALNALCNDMMNEVMQVLTELEADNDIHCVILTGSDKAFAAGADIKEMQDNKYLDIYRNDPFERYAGAIERFRKPIIAAVSGYALGGGCEIAMMCDFIIAADNAKFGQPEINLADMCLTGRMMEADEAERSGLVSRVVPLDELQDTVETIARKIAAQSLPIAMMTKETVNVAFETTLQQGIKFERRLFQSMFTTEDQKEGMTAFVEKRKPHFKNK